MGDYVLADNENFDSVISKGVVVVDFFATWCMPCKMLAPIIEELAHDNSGKATIAKLDIDQAEAVAIKYGVQSVPTVVVFKNGIEIDRIVGFVRKNVYQEIINKNL